MMVDNLDGGSVPLVGIWTVIWEVTGFIVVSFNNLPCWLISPHPPITLPTASYHIGIIT